MKRRRLVGETPYMGFGRRMAIAFFARSKNFFAIGGAAQFRPVQRPAAEAALSAATVGKPYKMCGLGLSELQFAISRPDSDSSREARGMPLRVRRRTEERRFSKSRLFFSPPQESTTSCDSAPDNLASAVRRRNRRTFRELRFAKRAARLDRRRTTASLCGESGKTAVRAAPVRLYASVSPACSRPTKPGCRAKPRLPRRKRSAQAARP